MSPEQARGSAGLDHRTDLYSMGTILFEMLTGVLPFAGNNFAEYLSAMLVDDPRAPQSVYADFPPEAEPLVRKALAKNPDQRFQNATEMLDALASLPSYDARQERLTLLASTLEVRGFAAGDLGQALSAPGRSAGDKALRRGFGARHRGGAGRWRWVVVGAALVALVAGLALWLRKPTKAPAPIAPIASQPVPLCLSHPRPRPVRAAARRPLPSRPPRASRRRCRAPKARQRTTNSGCEREEIQKEDTGGDCGAVGVRCPSRGGSAVARPERRQAWGQEAAQRQPRHRDVRGV